MNILALSGGGFKGLYTAKILERLEEELKVPIAQKFDLIAGTSIGGIIQRPESRVASILKGTGNRSDLLVFGNIPKEADVIKGDTVIASGYGGIYPKGTLIGTVKQVDVDKLGISLEALVKPAVDFTRLEEVFVVIAFEQMIDPLEIKNQVPLTEPAMNPNEQQTKDNKTGD